MASSVVPQSGNTGADGVPAVWEFCGEGCQLRKFGPFAGARFADAILESMDEGVAAMDPHGVIFFFSHRAEEITGFRATEVMGRRCDQVVCRELCVLGDAKLATSSFLRDVTITSRSGKHLELEVRGQPIYAGDRRTLLGRVVVFRDRTDEAALRRELAACVPQGDLVGASDAVRRIHGLIAALSGNEATVLLEGESGTGKELVAHAIHRRSHRAAGPFHAVNCGALPAELLESELFGHEKGAFSGAVREKPGRVELAQGGTLFLDEIGDLPLPMQVKLLRLLQEREFVRVGGTETRQLDARVIAATNVDLADAVRAGRFRSDLYYRLRVIPIRVPALRERREDVLPLAEHFLRRLAERNGRAKTLSAAANRLLFAHDWPGNVRELENALSYSYFMSPGDEISALDLPPDLAEAPDAEPLAEEAPIERERIADALGRAAGNKAKAARLLGINRTTLWRRMAALGMRDGP